MGGYDPASTDRRPRGERIAVGDFLRRSMADSDDVLVSPTGREAHPRGLEEDMRALAAAVGVEVGGDEPRREDLVRAADPRAGVEGGVRPRRPQAVLPRPRALLLDRAPRRAAGRPRRAAGGRPLPAPGHPSELHERALDLPIFSGVRRFRLDRGATTMSAVSPGAAAGSDRRSRERCRRGSWGPLRRRHPGFPAGGLAGPSSASTRARTSTPAPRPARTSAPSTAYLTAREIAGPGPQRRGRGRLPRAAPR